MNKAEISITIVVAAAIGLAILMIFLITFTSEAGNLRNVLSCEAKGGECMTKDACEYQKTGWQCPGDKPECCYKALGEA